MIKTVTVPAQVLSLVGRAGVRCPFHEEQTPSCSITMNPRQKKGTFHCFGCGEHGTVEALDAYQYLDNGQPTFEAELRTKEHVR